MVQSAPILHGLQYVNSRFIFTESVVTLSYVMPLVAYTTICLSYKDTAVELLSPDYTCLVYLILYPGFRTFQSVMYSIIFLRLLQVFLSGLETFLHTQIKPVHIYPCNTMFLHLTTMGLCLTAGIATERC